MLIINICYAFHSVSRSRRCTRALKWAPGPCVHVFSLVSEEFYPQSTSWILLQKWRLLTEQSGRKTTWVPRVWTKHHFVPCPGTSALARSVNAPLESEGLYCSQAIRSHIKASTHRASSEKINASMIASMTKSFCLL